MEELTRTEIFYKVVGYCIGLAFLYWIRIIFLGLAVKKR